MSILIRNAAILDAQIHEEQMDVLIDDDRIQEVGRALPARDAQILDFTGKTIMPGFIDSHIHAAGRGEPDDKMLRALAGNGIAAVRDLGLLGTMELEPYMRWLKLHRSAEYPQVVTAGRYIDIESGYGMGPDPNFGWGIKINTAEEGVKMVEYERRCGTDGLKLGLQDGGLGGPVVKMPPEFMRAMIEKAKNLGMWTTVHIGKVEDLRTIVECGADSAAHTPYDAIIDQKLLDTMVEKGISMTTTVGDPEAMIEKMPGIPPMFASRQEFLDLLLRHRDTVLENLRRFHETGGTILVGTDLMHVEDAEKEARIPTLELRYLRTIGLSDAEVIVSATVNNAAACGIDDLGLVRAGMRACLIGFSGKLDDQYHKLEAPPFVMNNGEILKQ